MAELYQCHSGCGKQFIIPEGKKYNDDPHTRKCIKCKSKGVMFIRSLGASMSYISDEMIGGMFCPADGKTYDSKSSYYKAVKSKGMEIVGNDPIKPSQPKLDRINWERAVKESIQQLT
jgi:hypothetical protein